MTKQIYKQISSLSSEAGTESRERERESLPRGICGASISQGRVKEARHFFVYLAFSFKT